MKIKVSKRRVKRGRVTVSMPYSLLCEIDEAAAARQITRSLAMVQLIRDGIGAGKVRA